MSEHKSKDIKQIAVLETEISQSIKPIAVLQTETSQSIKPIAVMQTEKNQSVGIFGGVRTLIDVFRSFDWKAIKESFLLIGQVLVSIFANIGRNYEALQKLSDHQFIYFGLLPEDILEEIITSNEPDLVLFEHLKANNFDEIDALIVKSKQKAKRYNCRKLYSQSVSAYRRNQYALSCVGFATVIDSLLSTITESELTNFKKRLEKLYKNLKAGEVIGSGEIDVIISALALKNAMKKFIEHSDFEIAEPSALNRHWISHGRSNREYSKLDCIKLLGMIYSILVIDFVGKGGVTDE